MDSSEMLGSARHVHFVGIGGIGMSGIAEVLINLGFEVSGSDMERSAITDNLAALGAKISIGHAAENLGEADIVVLSSAIGPDNPEVVAASESGVPLIPRSDMLGELMRIRTGIAIAGAHGKTTTTSLAAVVLQKAGLDPTVVVGGKVKSLDANAMLGRGQYLVAEVDESDGNFVRLTPSIAIITNIDAEHLDFYGGLEKIYEAFVTFASRVPFHGVVICCADDANVKAIMPKIERKTVTYGLDVKADVRGEIVAEDAGGSEFRLYSGGEDLGTVRVALPGRYNVSNAIAVCALAIELGIGIDAVDRALREFGGVGRRFEHRGEESGVLVVDDYGHHPTEIKAVVETARRNFDRRVIAVFQPHRFTRTRDLHESFDRCLLAADLVFVTDIYGAGETPIPGITGELIYRAVLKGGAKNAVYLPDRGDLLDALESVVGEGDIVITLGAGDIWKTGDELLERIRKNR
jgi:UDP-N-acetylmuramate--alanine ligase